MSNGGFAQGSLFDDIKAVEIVENAENKSLKNKLKIAEDCIQALKKELFSVEDSRRAEIRGLEKENHELKTAFSLVSAALKQAQRENAANIRWKEYYKGDMEAAWWLFLNEEEENKKLRKQLEEGQKQTIQPQRIPLFMPGSKNQVAKAACISPAIGK